MARYNNVVCDVCGKVKENVREYEPRPGSSWTVAMQFHLECPTCRKFVNKFRQRYRVFTRNPYETKELIKLYKGNRTRRWKGVETGVGECSIDGKIRCSFCINLADYKTIWVDEILRCYHCNQPLCYHHATMFSEEIFDCPDCAFKQHYLPSTPIIDAHQWNKPGI